MKYFLFFSLALFLFSCEKYDEEVLPVIGVYEANVVGVSGPFSISVSADFGNNVLIDAPWDGEHWEVIEATVRNAYEFEKRVRIHDQHYDSDLRIKGNGIFFDYSLQLDYSINVNGEKFNYTIVGTKL